MQRILFVLAIILGVAMAAPAPLSDHSGFVDEVPNAAYDALREASSER